MSPLYTGERSKTRHASGDLSNAETEGGWRYEGVLGWVGVDGVLVGGTRKKRLNLFCRKSSKGITTVFIEGKVTLGMNKGRVVCEGWGVVAGMQEAKRVGEGGKNGAGA